jgi:hypothetical protein
VLITLTPQDAESRSRVGARRENMTTPRTSAAGPAGREEQPSASAGEERTYLLDLESEHCYDGKARRARLTGAFCDSDGKAPNQGTNMDAGMARLKVEQHRNPTAGAWEARSGN